MYMMKSLHTKISCCVCNHLYCTSTYLHSIKMYHYNHVPCACNNISNAFMYVSHAITILSIRSVVCTDGLTN